MDRCHACPAVDLPWCAAASHRRYCELAAGGRAPWPERIRARSAAGPRPTPAVDEPPPAEPEPPPPRRPPGGAVQLWPLAFSGGAERAMISLLKATRDAIPWRGVALIAPANDPAIVAELAALTDVAQGEAEARSMIEAADLVVAWGVGALAEWLGPRPGPKLAIVSHSTSDSSWAVDIMSDDSRVDAYAAVSASALGPIPESRRAGATIIPNAVDPSRLTPSIDRQAIRDQWNIPPGAKVLGGLNRLSTEKRPHALAEAIAALPDDWFGVMIGGGAERDDLIAHASSVAPGRVIFPGSRTDVANVLGAFDSLLVSSEYESFCLSLAEALWSGVPAISTPVGIAAEHPEAVRLIAPGATGSAIASAVLADQADPDGTARRVAYASGLARQLWSPEANRDSWVRFLRGLLPEPELPSLLAMAGNYARAQVRHTLDGRRKAPPELAAARLRTCEACDRFRKTDRRCAAAGCGCWTESKTTWLSERCPLGRWPNPNEVTHAG